MPEKDNIARLFGYVMRYKGRLAMSVALAFVVSVTSAVSLVGLLPILEMLLEGNGNRVFSFEQAYGEVSKDLARLGTFLDGVVSLRIRSAPFTVLLLVCGVTALAVVLTGGFRFLQEYCSSHVAASVVRDLTDEMHENVIRLDLDFFQREGTGTLLSRFTNEMYAVSLGIKVLFGKAVREPLKAIPPIVLCAVISWRLLVFFPLIGAGVGILIATFGRRVRRASHRTLLSRSKMMSMMEEVFRGIRIVKVFGAEDYERGRFGEENRRVFRKSMTIYKADAAVKPAVEIIATLGGLTATMVGGYLVLRTGTMEPTALFGFFAAMAMAFGSLRKVSDVNNQFQACAVAAQRIFEFMDQTPAIEDAGDAAALARLAKGVRFEGVSFAYGDGPMVLRDINLDVNKGENVALVGPSGVGKTSLVNLIPRFYEPRKGRITIDGTDIASVTVASLRGQIGMVTQDTVLFNDTVANNIAYGKKDARPEQVVEAARRAHAHAFIGQLSDGYDTKLGEDGVDLSGGQRQRLAIARAILRDPAILILDEATSALDSESERAVQEALAGFVEGRTTFVIAHRLSTIMGADKVVVMNRGRIEAVGTHETLMDESPTYRALYTIQFGLQSDDG